MSQSNMQQSIVRGGGMSSQSIAAIYLFNFTIGAANGWTSTDVLYMNKD